MTKRPERRKLSLELDKSLLTSTLSSGSSISGPTNKSQPLTLGMVKRAASTPDEFFVKDIDRISTVTPKQHKHDSSSSKFICNTADDLKPLPLLRDAPVPDREKLLLDKLRLCCRMFDFTVPTSCLKSKEVKRQTLAEIADYIITNTHCLTTERVYEELLRMVRINAFRPLPPSSTRDDALGIPDSEDEVNLEPAWPHLQAVYEVFLRFLATPEYQAAVCKRYMDHTFIVGLLQLFDSEDPRERDYLKTILHRIYGKLVNLRPFIRKQINHIFLRFIYETERHNGIAELLEILASIINGFQIPLKEEHKVFLRYILLPLHKAHTLVMFQSQLAYCVTEFIKKDTSLLQTCLQDGLFKFWPKVDTQKEMLFINELEEFLECADPGDLQAVCKPLFQRIARCVSSTHFQVAERTLYLWSNDHFILILANFAEIGMPVLLPALYDLHSHWNKNLRPLVSNVLRMMEDMNQSLFNHCSLKAKEAKRQKTENEKRKAALWNSIEKAAKMNETMLCKGSKQTVRVALRSSVSSAPVSKTTEEVSLSGSFNWLNKYGLGSAPLTTQPSVSSDQAAKASTSLLPAKKASPSNISSKIQAEKKASLSGLANRVQALSSRTFATDTPQRKQNHH